MSGIEMVFMGLVLAAFAIFAVLVATLEVSERRKLGYRSGPESLRAVPKAAPANDAPLQKAA
jgi:hypothetical protein